VGAGRRLLAPKPVHLPLLSWPRLILQSLPDEIRLNNSPPGIGTNARDLPGLTTNAARHRRGARSRRLASTPLRRKVWGDQSVNDGQRMPNLMKLRALSKSATCEVRVRPSRRVRCCACPVAYQRSDLQQRGMITRRLTVVTGVLRTLRALGYQRRHRRRAFPLYEIAIDKNPLHCNRRTGSGRRGPCYIRHCYRRHQPHLAMHGGNEPP
jgi:hypothetical protein